MNKSFITKFNIIIGLMFLILSTLLHSNQIKFIKSIIPNDLLLITKLHLLNKEIYISNYKESVLHKIDRKKGNTIKKYGKLGQGPGELPYLADFIIKENYIILAGGRIINVFNKSGNLVNTIKTTRTIKKVISGSDKWYYVTTYFKMDDLKGIKKFPAFFSVYNSEEKICDTFSDETLQNPIHPKKNRKLRRNWFPSPFPNRPLFYSNNKNQLVIFKTREDSFQIIGEKTKSVKIQIKLAPKPVTPSDKEAFFCRISPKPAKITMNSVVFPATKELFASVIQWNNHWAILANDEFLIINNDGKFIQKYAKPKEIDFDNDMAHIEDLIKVDGKNLYYIKNNEEIYIFDIT